MTPPLTEEGAQILAVAHARRALFDSVLRQVGTWTDDDLRWLIAELEAGHIAPPPPPDGDELPCSNCGALTLRKLDGHPWCALCDAISDDDNPARDDVDDDDQPDEDDDDTGGEA